MRQNRQHLPADGNQVENICMKKQGKGRFPFVLSPLLSNVTVSGLFPTLGLFRNALQQISITVYIINDFSANVYYFLKELIMFV